MNPNFGRMPGRSSGRFESHLIDTLAISTASVHRISHSFGRVPSIVRAVLVHTGSESNFKPEVEYDLNNAHDPSNQVPAFNVFSDAGEIVVLYSGSAVRLLNEAGSNVNLSSLSNWAVKVYAAF